MLGPVELCYDGDPVEVSGATRTLLALIARSPGQEISTTDIVAGMWGERHRPRTPRRKWRRM